MVDSSSLVKRDREVLWHPYTPLIGREPLVVESAEKEFIYLDSGRKILDLVSSWWVNLHGHSHPHICETITKQIQVLDHVIFAGFTHLPAISLAERLLSHLPQGQERIFFSDNGSTAVEVAIKMAIQYWHLEGSKRRSIIVLEDSYHGDTVGAMSVSARGLFTKPFMDLLFDVIVVPRPTTGKDDFLECLQSALVSGEVAAFLYEPLVQGAGGMKFMDAEPLLEGLMLCRQHGVICIADEVMTGFGRTGRWFASDYLAACPDIICLSKGITGGIMPLGATSCSAEIVSRFRSEDVRDTFFHGHSFTGNPLACAVAGASLDLLESPVSWENIERISQQHRNAALMLKNCENIRNVRFLGTIIALDFIDSSDGYLSTLGPKLYQFFLDRDLLIRPLGNTVYLMPPYCTSSESLSRAYQALAEVAVSEEIFR